MTAIEIDYEKRIAQIERELAAACDRNGNLSVRLAAKERDLKDEQERHNHTNDLLVKEHASLTALQAVAKELAEPQGASLKRHMAARKAITTYNNLPDEVKGTTK